MLVTKPKSTAEEAVNNIAKKVRALTNMKERIIPRRTKSEIA